MNPTLTCPHCASTDIISVQGEYFCVNCGQTMAAPNVAATKRGPGRPKAKRLDVPKPEVTPGAAADETEQPAVPDAVPDEPPTAPVRMDAIRPRVDAPQPLVPTSRRVVFTWSLVLRRGLQGFMPLTVLLVLPGVVALLAAAVSAYGMRHNDVVGGAATGAWLVVGLLWLGFTRTAVMARQVAAWNHRAMTLRTAWSLALELAPRLIAGRLIFLFQELILGGAVAGVIWSGRYVSDLPYIGGLILVFIAAYVLLMLALIVWTHHSLLEAAMIQGDLTYRKARCMLARLPYWRLDIVGVKLFNLIAWMVAASGLTIVAASYLNRSADFDVLALAVVTAALICVTGYVVTTASLTGELFRQLASGLPPAEEAQVTAMARRPKRRHHGRSATYVFFGLLVLAATTALVLLAQS